MRVKVHLKGCLKGRLREHFEGRLKGSGAALS